MTCVNEHNTVKNMIKSQVPFVRSPKLSNMYFFLKVFLLHL